MIKSFRNRVKCYFKLHPLMGFCISLSFGVTILIVLSTYESQYQMVSGYPKIDLGSDNYPFPKLQNLVMVAGHSIYTSSSCGKVDKEDSWFLESYQKNPGQASTFVTHIKEGLKWQPKTTCLCFCLVVERLKRMLVLVARQSYWAVADSKGWFGKEESVKWRALTEEHARDSFVVSYDFKEDRFAHLHRSAIGFPVSRFFDAGTPATTNAKAAATKVEVVVQAQFQKDPFGCRGSLYHKKLRRDPFRRSIPYPNDVQKLKLYSDIVDRLLTRVHSLGHSEYC